MPPSHWTGSVQWKPTPQRQPRSAIYVVLARATNSLVKIDWCLLDSVSTYFDDPSFVNCLKSETSPGSTTILKVFGSNPLIEKQSVLDWVLASNETHTNEYIRWVRPVVLMFCGHTRSHLRFREFLYKRTSVSLRIGGKISLTIQHSMQSFSSHYLELHRRCTLVMVWFHTHQTLSGTGSFPPKVPDQGSEHLLYRTTELN